ncbi:MAG TPA: ATP-dependent DNA ligase [Planctomycetota bacterium]|nr:ATP-dependent DNA ligase [Planctomycetota bacterium]
MPRSRAAPSRPYPPMEARASTELPPGEGWQFEPKWDGFRCLLFRDDGDVRLQSRSGQPLERYFPELQAAALALRAKRCVLDGEIILLGKDGLQFDQLLQRIHPAVSRVTRLAREHPARLVVFDLLVDQRGTVLVERPLRDRRRRLERFAQRFLARQPRFALSPATTSRAIAERWRRHARSGLDGVMAKRLDAAYASGERSAMVKVKRRRTADCVVGGFRLAARGEVIGSLLLGLYDAAGLLHHVGFTSSLPLAERRALTPRLWAERHPPGFTGRAPGGPSRWSHESREWHPLRPELVVEVEFDHSSGGRFRHGTRFLRWRPDKAARQCRLDQLDEGAGGAARLLQSGGGARPRRATGVQRSRRAPGRPR